MGCGKHIPMVMDSIADDERCTCTPKTVVNGKEYPPQAGAGKKQVAGAKVDISYEA